jgi:4-hydroxy-2-oxoheptanedioate aldolase
MKMRESQVLKKLRSGQNVCCFKMNLCSAQAVELVALTGFDCIWLDQEHVATDWAVISAQIWAAKAHDTDVMVRVSRGGYSDYIKAFECDATGILVPHIMNVEDARRVIHTTRFHPVGRRPVDGGNSDGGYCMIEMNDYLKQANEQRFISLQIEDPEPLDTLEEIAALEGFDMLFFGPADFSQGIGAPGQWNHPELLKTRERVAKVAHQYGKFAATVGSLDNLRDLIDMGYNFINIGSDVTGLIGYCRDLEKGFRSI